MAGVVEVGREIGWRKKLQQAREQAVELLHFPPFMTHVALVLVVGCLASSFKLNLLFVLTLGFLYLCYIESRQRLKVEIKIRHDERKVLDRKKLLSEDAESARWLNYVVETMWPLFLENFASQGLLMPLASWFLDKYKPWTAKRVVLQQLYLGGSPPVFTLLRAGRHAIDGDHLVLEMTVNFSAAPDMSALMAVQMKKRVGLGIWTSFHISNVQVVGKLKVSVKFVKGWPVVGRLRLCFCEAPIIRMVAKPVFSYGVDVTDVPGIAAWLDKIIIDVLERSLIEPILLEIDVEKLVGDMMSFSAKVQKKKARSPEGNFTLAEDTTTFGIYFDSRHVQRGTKLVAANLLVEILKAEQLTPSDPNGKADPYVKIKMGQSQFKTSIKRKTLNPSWNEEFHVPIESWSQPNLLHLRVRDKDRFSDDKLGHKVLNLEDFKDGQRHAMSICLEGVKTGFLHVALTAETPAPIPDQADEALLAKMDGRNVELTSCSAGSVKETVDPSKSECNAEATSVVFGKSVTESESPAVDAGSDLLRCVSIVNSGRHARKEVYRKEGSHQHICDTKGPPQRERQRRELSSEAEESNPEQSDLASPRVVSEKMAKRDKMRKLLGRSYGRRNAKKDVLPDNASGSLSGNGDELVMVGSRGTEMHLKLELDEDEIEDLEELGLDEEKNPEFVSADRGAGSQDGINVPDRWKIGSSSTKSTDKRKIRQAGKTMIKQVGKTAYNIGHGIKPMFHSGRSSLSPSLEREIFSIPGQNEASSSDEGLWEERGLSENLDFCDVDDGGEDMANKPDLVEDHP